jgi:hypothetical protein
MATRYLICPLPKPARPLKAMRKKKRKREKIRALSRVTALIV